MPLSTGRLRAAFFFLQTLAPRVTNVPEPGTLALAGAALALLLAMRRRQAG